MPRFSFLLCFALAGLALLFAVPLRAAYTEENADQIFDAYNQAFYQSQTNGRAYYRENTDGGRAWFWGQANMIEMEADSIGKAPAAGGMPASTPRRPSRPACYTTSPETPPISTRPAASSPG